MKDSAAQWIGKIPDSWEIVRLKNILTQNDGGVWGNEPSGESDTMVLRSTEQTVDGKWAVINPAMRDLSEISNFRYYLVRPDDLLMTKSSGSGQHIGKTTIVDESISSLNCCYSNFMQRLRLSSRAFPRYYWYVFNSRIAREQFVYKRNSTLGIGNINAQDIGGIFVPLPNLKEQMSIVSALDPICAEIDAIIGEAKASVEEYKRWKTSVIYQAVTKGLDPDAPMKESNVQWLGEIPYSWTLSKMAFLYALRNKKVSDKEYPPLSVTMKGIVPQLATAAKTDDGDNRKLVKVGDFAINSRSDRRGSCGISSYDGSVSLINTVLIPRNQMNPEYYNWLFHSELFADEFYRCGHGIVDDLWTTRWQEMKRIIVPVPSLPEQERIAHFLNTQCAEIDSVISEKQSLISELEAYKKSLIYEAVTGKRKV